MRRFARRSRWMAPLAGFAALALVAAHTAFDPLGFADRIREALFDRLIAAFPRAPLASPVLVVDIDRAALDRFGSWPWPRETLARLAGAAVAAKPLAIGFDMLLAEARAAGDAPPPNVEALASALRGAPVALGVVLDPSPAAAAPEGPPLGLEGEPPDLPDLLVTRGVTAPVRPLIDAAKGLGVLTLPASDGEPVRRVPLLAAGGGVVYGGIAVETLRIGSGDGNLLIDGRARTLRVGGHVAPLARDASLRLWTSSPAHRAARTVAAASLLDAPDAAREKFTGKFVLIGASAPEAGGLRETAADAFTPTVQIEADTLEQIIDNAIPIRPAAAFWVELAVAALLAVLGVIAVIKLTPARAAVATIVVAALWCAVCVILWRWRALLVDPLWPVVTALGAWQASNFAAFAEARARRVALERSFATRLPPAIVARLAEDPELLKLAGEEREITALFTDLEGFTAMTERIGPVELVALLDRYFACVCAIVVEHGGMVDKFVGDAVHAFFNAPVELPDHAARAVDCALSIHIATEAFRIAPENAHLKLGRTRIGVETGRAILGDVGASGKLDYTAHGTAINLASRLEASNKKFGSAIAVGPRCVALATRHRFRELGTIEPFAGAASLIVSEPCGVGAADAKTQNTSGR
ncbi:adenylate/guanylate cyclase domain-containing protein [Terrarubrum flagellatum]|uniref:adenylate/guanylate cyclase domain-containing protein n=1 Tax=Terrirubrum flagellatum TaxID=2895980 RepID=UPI003145330A